MTIINLLSVTGHIQLLLIFDYDFLSDYPSLMRDIGIRYMQLCQTILERGACELASSIFILFTIQQFSILWI